MNWAARRLSSAGLHRNRVVFSSVITKMTPTGWSFVTTLSRPVSILPPRG
jgi:hypothetical protein